MDPTDLRAGLAERLSASGPVDAQTVNAACFMLSRAIEELALSVPEAAPLARRMLRVVGPARILSVAERFEALTAGRSSARATPQAAFEQVVAGSGSEFDPAIVEGLRRAVHEGNFELNLPAVALPAAAVATA